ncbi:unnamed protein product, partial [Vitis vinifera]
MMMAWAGATYLSHPVLAFRIFRLGKKWMTVGGGVMYISMKLASTDLLGCYWVQHELSNSGFNNVFGKRESGSALLSALTSFHFSSLYSHSMTYPTTSNLSPKLLLLSLLLGSFVVASVGNLYQDFDITWGDGRAKILNNGQLLTLSLDKASGSGFRSNNEYLFGKIDMQLKLVPGNSAGTVTAYYLSSQGPTHDEIDFEFLGNLSGDPYILHTNVFSQGKGNREQQFYLWFDPTADFHTYSVLWNPQRIIFSVDGTPIREFKNSESIGVPYPKNQPMRIYSSLWNADDWATRGGLVKTDWSQELDSTSQERMTWVQKNYMIYNYCTDTKRFPQGLPPECTATTMS